MSQENVEVVRRYYEATQRAFVAYWEDPRPAAEALEAGDISPEAVEMTRFLHPNAEWKTALTGITYRRYSDWPAASISSSTLRRPIAWKSRRSPLSEATGCLPWCKQR